MTDISQAHKDSMFDEADTLASGEPSVSPIHCVVVGRVSGLDSHGCRVKYRIEQEDFESNAITTTALTDSALGNDVALSFVNGDRRQPIVLGEIYQSTLDQAIVNFSQSDGEVAIDNDDVKVIEAKEELVLRCGESSIHLSKNGKISLRGRYLVSRATGVNRILGGSVQVN